MRRAFAAWDEGVAFVREHRVHFFEGFLARDAARLHTSDGEPEAALVLFADAIAAFHRAGNVPQLIITLASVPALFERLDRLHPRRCSSARCLASRRASTTSPSSADLGDRVSRKLGKTRAAELMSAGAALDLGDAAVYARQQIDVARRDPSPRTRQARPGGLSRREIEVLRLVADGRTAGEIATQLFISSRTAEHHIQNIYTKIGVSSRAAATRWAVQHEVVDDGDRPSRAEMGRSTDAAAAHPENDPRRPNRSAEADPQRSIRKGTVMILATTTVENVDRFLDVFGKGRREARPPRLQGFDGVPRPDRGEPRLGAVRLGRAGLGELRLRPRGPADPQGGRTPGKPQAACCSAPTGVRGDDDHRINRPARVGLITDQTGALSFMGIANANVAKMVIDDINARGGLLGRPVELFVEDSATDDSVAEAAAAKLVERAVDVVVGGIYSSTRQAIKGPVVDEAETLYIYPEQYEGQECHPLIFCTGPVPAQQVEPFFPWLMEQTGARSFYMPSADYIWPHTMNKKVREVVTAGGGEIVGEEYFPLDHTDYERVVDDIMSTGAEVVFNTIVPPGLTPFLEQLHRAGFTRRGGHIVCTYFDENFLNLVPADHVEGLYGCLDYYRDVDDPFSIELLNRYERALPRERDVHRRECVLGNLPGPQALGGCRQRSRVPEPGGHHRGTRPRPDRARPGRPCRDGAGPAPRADEHVHRASRRAARSRW